MTDQAWTNEDLRAWRHRLGLTQAEAARALGITHRGYQKREAGDTPISREAMLACLYLEACPEAR